MVEGRGLHIKFEAITPAILKINANDQIFKVFFVSFILKLCVCEQSFPAYHSGQSTQRSELKLFYSWNYHHRKSLQL